MAATQLVAGQCGGQHEQRVGRVRLVGDEGSEGAVEFTHPAVRDPEGQVG